MTPNETAQYSNCLILEEYASQPSEYFKNNTIFLFEPGSHRLNRSLNFTNLHNFTLLGKHSEVINVLLGRDAIIRWENCSNIEIASISFTILDFIFSFSIITFEHSHLILHFSDVSVLDYENESGYSLSAVWSLYSTLHIQDSKFAGIQGLLGAVM